MQLIISSNVFHLCMGPFVILVIVLLLRFLILRLTFSSENLLRQLFLTSEEAQSLGFLDHFIPFNTILRPLFIWIFLGQHKDNLLLRLKMESARGFREADVWFFLLKNKFHGNYARGVWWVIHFDFSNVITLEAILEGRFNRLDFFRFFLFVL